MTQLKSIPGLFLMACLLHPQFAEADLWVPSRTPPIHAAAPIEKSASTQPYSTPEQRRLKHGFDLGKVDSIELKTKTQQPNQGPTKAGFVRKIQGLDKFAAFHQQIEWQASPDGGKMALLSFRSPDALGIRLAIRVKNLPDESQFRFFSSTEETGKVIDGKTIMEHIQRNREAGAQEPLASTFWSPLVEGEHLILEIHLPPNVPTEALRISTPQISHIFLPEALGKSASGLQARIGESSSCNNDAMCNAAWTVTGNAVARMLFTDSGNSYLCTGTLLNDLNHTNVPYFLSANHCISTQAAASTLITYWFYHSSACNSGALNPAMSTLNSGATLLYQSATTDTSFMRLNAAPPSGATFAGWTTATINIGDPSTSLSNPQGDMQKISTGQLAGFLTCTPPVNGSFTCQSATSDTGTFDNIVFSSGITESGSSGSGIFLNNGQYLYGQLYGGNSSCANPSGSNMYGRFDKAYASGNFSQWLATGSYSLSTTKSGSGTGNITSTPSGINCGSSCNSYFASGQTVTLSATPASGSYFSGWSGDCSGGSSCSLTMNGNKAATAGFQTIPTGQVVLSVSQTGLGNINSNPSGINCSAGCSSSFPTGTTVTLTATPVTGYYFAGWGGACSGSGSCTLTLSSNQSVAASFTAIPSNNFLLTVSVNGGGSITSIPTGINCTTNCSYPFPAGSLVTLIASADKSQTFMGWSGSSCSGKGSCSTPMNSNHSEFAKFTNTYLLILPAINYLMNSP